MLDRNRIEFTMEFGAFFVFVGVFGLCAGLVFIVSVFGVQGETFEEALEKQRNQSKEKKEKKKPPTEKKKRVKKAKESKQTQEIEEENLLIDPSGNLVEPVFVESIASPMSTEPMVFEKGAKKKGEEKKNEKNSQEVKSDDAKGKKPELSTVNKSQKVVIEEAAPVKEPVFVQEEMVQKEAKVEKKKMEIVDVEEIKSAEQEEKKKKPAKEKQKQNKRKYDEIQDVIRKSALTDTEAQGIVDMLLKQQTGKEERNSDWIEPGKETESKKMTRKVTELQADLNDEKEKSNNLEKKIASLRKELNEGKSTVACHRRELEEINVKKNQEINSINTRLQQILTQMNSTLALNRKLEANQSHYQATINNLQTQLSQVSGTSDSKLLSEIEQLKNSRNEMSSSNHALQQELAHQCSEMENISASKHQLEVQLAKICEEKEQQSRDLQQIRGELNEERSESKQLQSQLKENLSANGDTIDSMKLQYESKLSALEAMLSSSNNSKQQLQNELTSLKGRYSEKEIEASRLMEENDRLSEQVASSVERPAADGQEATKMNGHVEEEQKPVVMSEDSVIQEKCSVLNRELEESQVRCRELESELKLSKTEVSTLRKKNEDTDKEMIKFKDEVNGLFLRVFSDSSLNIANLDMCEETIKSHIQGLKSVQNEGTTEELSRLEAQNCNYKVVLAQTENMLTSLQASVESTESEWKKKLALAERQNVENKQELQNLRYQNVELQNSVDSFNQIVQDLESKKSELESEKLSKEQLALKCTELQELLVAGQRHSNSSEEA